MEKLLRFYLSNTDMLGHDSLYEVIAQRAQSAGLAGTTVYQGIMGYGATSKLRSNKFWELNVKYPVIVEIIDEERKLKDFLGEVLPDIDDMPKGCLVTMQNVDIVMRKRGDEKDETEGDLK